MRGKPVKGQGTGGMDWPGSQQWDCLGWSWVHHRPPAGAQQLVWQEYQPFLFLLFLKGSWNVWKVFLRGNRGCCGALVCLRVSVRVFTYSSQASRTDRVVLIVWACLPGCRLLFFVLFSRNKQIKWRKPIWKKYYFKQLFLVLSISYYKRVVLGPRSLEFMTMSSLSF